jgi:HD-like signal output (HDOD) protein
MRRVLFVDDEVSVLDGLRDRLRKQRREWEMVFALGGAAALAECARSPFDVVVSDMRMPGMDGAELLQRIKDSHPGTVRIILSGHAERNAIMRTLTVAHQYLSKPCDAEVLSKVIARACALQTVLNNASIRQIVGGIEKLPSVSKTYMELTEVLAGKAPSIEDVGRVVERDPAMCLKLLQVVNSAFFGLPRHISTMREAITYLGIELVKSLVVAAQIFAAAEGPGGLDGALLAGIQRHSIRVARLARALAPSHGDSAFMAGMLHDVGRIVLALADRSTFSAVATDARERGVPEYVVEQERLGLTHAEVGAYLLGSWGVPFSIGEAVAGHHEPQRFCSVSFDAMTAVHIAEALTLEDDDESSGAQRSILDKAYLDKLGVLEQLPRWIELAQRTRDGTGD